MTRGEIAWVAVCCCVMAVAMAWQWYAYDAMPYIPACGWPYPTKGES